MILASSSPRRAWLLGEMGVSYVVVHPDIPEDYLPGELPEEHVTRLASEKAGYVYANHPATIVLAADTAVVLDGTIYGKPSGYEDALRMLRALCGRTHFVYTGYAVMGKDSEIKSGFEESLVTIRKLNPSEIKKYLALYEYNDKAGGYAAQGAGAKLIEKIDGSFTNVVGLPLEPIGKILMELGFKIRIPDLKLNR